MSTNWSSSGRVTDQMSKISSPLLELLTLFNVIIKVKNEVNNEALKPNL